MYVFRDFMYALNKTRCIFSNDVCLSPIEFSLIKRKRKKLSKIPCKYAICLTSNKSDEKKSHYLQGNKIKC